MSSISLDTISSQAVNFCNYIYENLYSLASRIANLFKDLTDWISSWFTDQNKQIELKKPVTSSRVESIPPKITAPITPEKTAISTEMFLDFYRGTGTDIKGRTLDEILSWDDKALEDTHDFIQWLFPNRTSSKYNSNPHPLLNDEMIHAFKIDNTLQANLCKAFTRMLAFYGFGFKKEDFANDDGILKDRYVHTINQYKLPEWVTPDNHNFKRITRILSCMSDLGFPQKNLVITLGNVSRIESIKGAISNKTLAFWESTVGAI